MPELPEVETIRRGIMPWVRGKTITSVDIRDQRILGTTAARTPPPDVMEIFIRTVVGSRISEVFRRGKFLWLPLTLPYDSTRGDSQLVSSPLVFSPPDTSAPVNMENTDLGWALCLHLGMSGQLRIHAPTDPLHRHTRAVLEVISPGQPSRQVRFVDQRIFGHVGIAPLFPDPHALVTAIPAPMAHIAADPLEPGWNAIAVANALSRKKLPIKAALLNQTLVSGIGNIYADEALFRAGVHPRAQTLRLRRNRIVATLETAREVMSDAIAEGGTSFDDLYVHVNGESGYFSRSLRVYGREGQPCLQCGTVIQRHIIAGRSSYFCPHCQKPQRLR